MSDESMHFEILKIELSLLQSRFDKYDDLIFRSRQWALVLWIACLSLSSKKTNVNISNFIYIIPLMFFSTEGLLRFFYWYKYVTRYRLIRKTLNENINDYKNISLYDLTNHYNYNSTKKERLKSSFVKPDSLFFYGALFVLSWIIV